MASIAPPSDRTFEDLDYAERTASTVVGLLTGSATVRPCDLASLTDSMVGEDYHHVLADIIEELRLSRLTVLDLTRLDAEEVATLAEQAPPGMSTEVWKLTVAGANGPTAQIWISTSESGAISGLRLDVERPAPIRTLAALRDNLSCIDAQVGIHLTVGSARCQHGPIKDVASLYKLVVLVALQRAIDDGIVTPDQPCQVEHFTPLSSGLTPRHKGHVFTVEEIARLMILRSDNTAADQLVRLIGAGAVQTAFVELAASAGIPADTIIVPEDWLMHRYVEEAWGLTEERHSTIEEDRLHLRPVHSEGLGFFIPIAVVATALERAAAASWHPWPAPPPRIRATFYKGGNAPGVRSSAYHRPATGPTAAATTIVVALNDDEPFGALEDLYLTHCIESVLEHITTLPNPIASIPLVPQTPSTTDLPGADQ